MSHKLDYVEYGVLGGGALNCLSAVAPFSFRFSVFGFRFSVSVSVFGIGPILTIMERYLC